MRALRSVWIVLIVVATTRFLQLPAVADEGEELQKSLEAAELSFAASVARQDWESFGDHIDQNAIFATGTVHTGKPAILEAWSGFFGEEAPRMEWHPETVVVRAGGKLGISKGPYTLTRRDADGTVSTQKGQFISIWARQENGGWKIIFDSGCPPCPDCGSD